MSGGSAALTKEWGGATHHVGVSWSGTSVCTLIFQSLSLAANERGTAFISKPRATWRPSRLRPRHPVAVPRRVAISASSDRRRTRASRRRYGLRLPRASDDTARQQDDASPPARPPADDRARARARVLARSRTRAPTTHLSLSRARAQQHAQALTRPSVPHSPMPLAHAPTPLALARARSRTAHRRT